MIASSKNALRVGSAKLVVDGTDELLCRKATIALSPGRVLSRRLDYLHRLSVEVYNAALEARRGAWRISNTTVTRFDQFGEITSLRMVRPDVTRFGNQFIRGSISRVDEAYTAFFRRLRSREKPGFPRFKSRARLRSIFYDEPMSWKLKLEGKRPSLYVQGVGDIVLSKRAVRQLRRLLDRGGEARTLVITKTPSGAWRAAVGFRDVTARRLAPSTQVTGVDRGISVTAALADGTHYRMPGFLKEARDTIAELQREREHYTKGSAEWKKLNRKVAKAYRRARYQSENWARHVAREIVMANGVIVIEDLKLTQMSKSAKGTKEAPGKNVNAKAGLNRSLQEAALGRLSYWICVKAEEAGRRLWRVNPKDSSRECAACGHTESKNRNRNRFKCLCCRHTQHADTNAAQVVAARGESADARWLAEGAPLLTRPLPRSQRRKGDAEDGVGSAPYAKAA